MRLTPEQLIAQWQRVVAAHKADTKLDTDFALLASLNVEINDNFFTKTFYLIMSLLLLTSKQVLTS